MSHEILFREIESSYSVRLGKFDDVAE